MFTDSLDYKTAFKFWYRGFRLNKKGHTDAQRYWLNYWTPAKGTEAWFQMARGINGEAW